MKSSSHIGQLMPALILVTALGAVLPRWAYADEWRQINDGGFGEPSNITALAMAPFDGHLYVATLNRSGSGSEVWKTRLGASTWREVTPGWSSATERPLAMAVFDGNLYVGTDVGEVWRTFGEVEFLPCVPSKVRPGCLPIRSFPRLPELWFQVTPMDLDWMHENITSMAVFGTQLYLASSSPLEIWRTADGINWERVVEGGFDDPENNHSGNLGVFRGQIYVGTSREVPGSTPEEDDGLEIWRSANGVDWEPIVANDEPGALLGRGFGFPGNATATSLTVFDGRLYVSTVNHTDFAQVWRFDSRMWEEVTPPAFSAPFGGSVRVQSMAAFVRRLFVGEGFRPNSAIWATRTGDDWSPANEPGFGDLLNISIDAMTASSSHLYVTANNSETGVQVWRKSRTLQDMLPELLDDRGLICVINPIMCDFVFGESAEAP